MSREAHTAGPWTWSDCGWWVIGADDQPLAEVFCSAEDFLDPREDPEASANARLIAAAPALLEAATLAEPYLETLHSLATGEARAIVWKRLVALRAAIQSATGEG
ncbi:MAG: hypothetical protein ACO1SX_06890 [Actinomycetota bacterium]